MGCRGGARGKECQEVGITGSLLGGWPPQFPMHSLNPFQIPDVKSRLIREDPNAGKDRRQEEKGTQRMDGTTDLTVMSLSKLQETVKDRGVYSLWGCKGRA